MKFSFLYASRQIFSPQKKGFTNARVVGAFIGIVLSLIPMMVVMVVVDGMIDGISNRFLALGESHIKIHSYGAKKKDEIEKAIQEALLLPEVKSAIASVHSKGIVINPVNSSKIGVEIKGFPPDLLEKDEGYKKYLEITEGEFDLSAPKKILISDAVAKELGLKINDTVQLLMIAPLRGKEVPIKIEYTISGFFTTGYYQIDNTTVYVNFNQVFPLFSPKGVQIFLKLQNPHKNLYRTTQDVRARVNFDDSWQVSSWETNNRMLFQNLEDTRFLIMIVMIGILIVTGFNILSTFFMIVREKENEIAILKSCGVPGRKIVLSFLFSGIFLASIATLLGIGLGIFISQFINEWIQLIENLTNFSFVSSDYYLEKIPVVINWGKVGLIAFFSILLAFIFTLFPAILSGKIKPIEVIRHH